MVADMQEKLKNMEGTNGELLQQVSVHLERGQNTQNCGVSQLLHVGLVNLRELFPC